ncbi:MAG: DUF2244 domain-containing protein [Gammaproteobacteria bacterium]|nr:DUF2244 domain-containing protein [Gammaproteobacteria bacterium]
MAISESQNGDGGTVYLIQPNRSLTPCQLGLACALICVALVAVAIYFSLQGAWLIAPFAGLEIALVVTAICYQCRWSGQKQRIHVGEREVRMDSTHRDAGAIKFPKGWLRIELLEPVHDWHPRRLLIGAHGRYLEVGAFLEESERERLACSLRSVVQQAN